MEKPENRNKNLIELIAELIREVISFIRQYYELLKDDLRENAFRVGKSILLFAFALAIAYIGIIFLGILSASLLSQVMPGWVAFLIVTGSYFILAILMLVYALRLLSRAVRDSQKMLGKKDNRDNEDSGEK